MAERRRWTLKPIQASYIKSEIESGSVPRSKRALQWLCKLYRQGAVLPQDARTGMEIAVLGVLISAASDEKVRRWALAALAYIGRREVSKAAVLRALSDYQDEPQVLAAAVATLFKFEGEGAQGIISKKGVFSEELIALAALQTASPREVDVSSLKINIDTADAINLKLALLLVGLNRSPDNIFDPRHDNAKIVKILGGHHEPVVSQYSVWAASENPNLSVGDIGIDLRELDSHPANVRSYVYRLYAADFRITGQRLR